MITLQKLFNNAWQHIIVNGNPPAIGETGFCAYETADGNHCAIGKSLPKNHPALKVIDSFASIVDSFPELFDSHIVNDMTVEDLDDFQSMLHDDHVKGVLGSLIPEWNCTKEELMAKYIQTAMIYGLNIPE